MKEITIRLWPFRRYLDITLRWGFSRDWETIRYKIILRKDEIGFEWGRSSGTFNWAIELD